MVNSIREAIAKGEEKAGGQRGLATQLGCTPSVVADAKAGRRGLPAFQLVTLAAYVGEDAASLLVLDVLDRERDDARREVMRRVFFSVAAHGVLALCCLLTTGQEAPARTLKTAVSSLDERNIVALKQVSTQAPQVWRRVPAV